MNLKGARKLISLTGFKGFQDQCQEDEAVVIAYRSRSGQEVFQQLDTEGDFENLVYNALVGHEITGFFAAPKLPHYAEMSVQQVANVRHVSDSSYTIRPVEHIVFMAIKTGYSIEALLTGQY